MIKVAVCDDEEKTVENIEANLLKYAKLHNLMIETFKFYSGESLVSSEEKFDIIFLDGQMKGMDGIETASQIRESNMDIAIVFITAFPYFSRPSHTVHSFDFIDKPFKYEDFERVLNDFLRINKKETANVIDFHLEHGEVIMQNADDIIYIERDTNKRRKAIMQTVKDGKICIISNMSEILSKLDGRQFFMTHAAYIINLRHVIRLKGLYTIIMTNNIEIPLSQKRKEEFKDKLHKYAVMNRIR